MLYILCLWHWDAAKAFTQLNTILCCTNVPVRIRTVVLPICIARIFSLTSDTGTHTHNERKHRKQILLMLNVRESKLQLVHGQSKFLYTLSPVRIILLKIGHAAKRFNIVEVRLPCCKATESALCSIFNTLRLLILPEQ